MSLAADPRRGHPALRRFEQLNRQHAIAQTVRFEFEHEMLVGRVGREQGRMRTGHGGDDAEEDRLQCGPDQTRIVPGHMLL
jgi:hypothetical protein